MPLTDIVILFILFLYFIYGYHCGLLKTLWGPISFFLGGFIAFFYFQKTHHLLNSLAIGILGPLLINLSVSQISKLRKKETKKPDYSMSFNRMLAAGISLFWGGLMLSLLIIFIAIFPTNDGWTKNLKDNLLHSKSYALLNQCFAQKLPTPSDPTKPSDDNKWKNQLAESREYADLMSEPKIKELYADKTTAQQIKEQNFVQLLTNPKIHSLLEDQKILDKFVALNKKMIELNSKETP